MTRPTRIQQLQHQCSALKDRIAAAKKRHMAHTFLCWRLVETTRKLIEAEMREEKRQERISA